MSVAETEIPRTAELWLPGMSLDHEHPIPTIDELVDHWADTHGHIDVFEAPGVFGAVRTPDQVPTFVASIDLCEVVRHTKGSLLGVAGIPLSELDLSNTYHDATSVSDDAVQPIIQTLMNHDHVDPIEGIEEIRDIMRSWRELGAYVVANTSTLPGCETSTTSFLHQYLEGCFDGIVFPRNHDGSGPISKGHALAFIIDTYCEPSKTRALHIDDTFYHCNSVKEHVSALIGADNISTIMPVYPGSPAVPKGTISATSPMHAFMIADSIVSA
ncbi:MAG: hypothetical protein NTX11_00095 [Candidatus Saccharibacteria bacterium]|nr:hypothetical protein [Candidatus Saccharibacteria bacterium]